MLDEYPISNFQDPRFNKEVVRMKGIRSFDQKMIKIVSNLIKVHLIG